MFSHSSSFLHAKSCHTTASHRKCIGHLHENHSSLNVELLIEVKPRRWQGMFRIFALVCENGANLLGRREEDSVNRVYSYAEHATVLFVQLVDRQVQPAIELNFFHQSSSHLSRTPAQSA
jgi:hypothetical protein